MNRSEFSTTLLTMAALSWSLTASALAGSSAVEDFEDDSVGVLPNCPWLDVGQAPAIVTAPSPSATVVTTTDAAGLSTRALALVDAVADSQGIHTPMPVSSRYVVRGDIRIDQFSDGGTNPVQEGLGIFAAQMIPDFNLCCVPAVGIYASGVTDGWRLYVAGATGLFEDIDLQRPVTIGTWYRTECELIVASGVIRSRIWDVASGALLVDHTHTVAGWTSADGPFDTLGVIDVEVSRMSTIGNVAVFDNISYSLGFDQPCATGDLDGDGDVDGIDLAILLGRWTGSK